MTQDEIDRATLLAGLTFVAGTATGIGVALKLVGSVETWSGAASPAIIWAAAMASVWLADRIYRWGLEDDPDRKTRDPEL